MQTRKMTRTDLIIWGVSGLLVVALPLGAVMLEGKTGTDRKQTAQQQKSPTQKPRRVATAAATPPRIGAEFVRAPINKTPEVDRGSLPATRPSAATSRSQEPNAGVTVGSAAALPSPSNPSEALEDAINRRLANSIPFYGGDQSRDTKSAPDDSVPAVPESRSAASGATGTSPELAAASPETPAESAARNGTVLVAISPSKAETTTVTPDAVLAANPDSETKLNSGTNSETKLNTETKPDSETNPGTKPDSETALDGVKQDVAKPETSQQPAEKAEKPDLRERVEIVLIRPKNLIAPQHEQVIFRTNLKNYSHAFVLVRSRQRDAEWWVQGVTIRQGPFFRARAQFGNAASQDGSLFKMTIAFVKSIDDLPEDGTTFPGDIPERFLLSQEFDVTLKRQ